MEFKKHGIFQISISIIWLIFDMDTWHEHHVRSVLHVMEIPKFLIIYNFLFGIALLILGIATFINRAHSKYGYFVMITGWLTTLILTVVT